MKRGFIKRIIYKKETDNTNDSVISDALSAAIQNRAIERKRMAVEDSLSLAMMIEERTKSVVVKQDKYSSNLVEAKQRPLINIAVEEHMTFNFFGNVTNLSLLEELFV